VFQIKEHALLLARREEVRATKRGKNLLFQQKESLKAGQSFFASQQRRAAHFSGY